MYIADSVDLAIAIGHGEHHLYQAGPSTDDIVDFSGTAFGNCASCDRTGDLEYLVVFGCRVLSMKDAAEDYANPSPSHSFDWFWFNDGPTARDRRPFAGLHMVLSFRTDYRLDRKEGREFMRTFANHLDAGMGVIDAWQEAGAELDFDDNRNRTAVLYLGEYVDDKLSTTKNDYIYPNARNLDRWIDFYE